MPCSFVRSATSFLITTRRFKFSCCPRYTWPIPPRPRERTMRYRPPMTCPATSSTAGTRPVYYVAALLLAACGVPQGEYFGHIPDDIDPHHLRWCNQGEPDSLDPA